MTKFASLGLVAAAALVSPVAATPPGAWTYPAAPRGDVIDDYHGTQVADPYRWLEDLDSVPTKAWVAAENRLTTDFLHTLPQRPWFHDRLTQLWNYTRYGLPVRQGGVIFYTKNNGLQNQGVLYDQGALDPAPRLLLDPNTLSADGTVALSDWEVSRDGRWLAYATETAGSDWNEIRVRNVASAQDTGDLVRWVKFSGIAWTRDGQGFFYSRFPEVKLEGKTGATFAELAGHKLYYHRRGTPQTDDRLILELPDQPKWLLSAQVTDDGRYAVIGIARGDSNFTLLRYLDLGDPAAPSVNGPVVKLVDTWDAEYSPIDTVGPLLYVSTNLGAPRRKIIAIDTRQPDPAHWRTIVPESADVIESASLVGGKLVILAMHDASSRIRVYGLDGQTAGEIALPGIGSVGAISGRADDSELFYNFTSFTYPNTNFRHDLATGQGTVFSAPKVAFDPAAFETKQIFYRSKDGTRVPMFITAKKGLTLDGTAPTLLYAYGGFDISITPAFSVADLVWLEMGGVYAQPNLRGGGEYGREWHEAGTKERKQNVFDDFAAAAGWLFVHGYTAPAHLVISGDSNGGLLIGATLNQHPDLCRVAWPGVGVMDMLRFQKFTIGWAWEADYGSSDDPAGFRYLRAFSPVHNVRAGASYPAVLVTTADHDDRVYPAHSFKFVAQLQAAVADGPDALPVMIRIDTKAGHGGGMPTAKRIDEAADKLAFAAHFLGLNPQDAPRP
jgi:prolyl oligopeptidase